MRIYPAKIIYAQHKISSISKAIHYEKPVGKHPPDVRKVEQDVTIWLFRRSNVRLYTCNCGELACCLSSVNCAI